MKKVPTLTVTLAFFIMSIYYTYYNITQITLLWHDGVTHKHALMKLI